MGWKIHLTAAVTMDGSEDVDQDDAFLNEKSFSSSDFPEGKAVLALVANCAHDLKTPLAAVYNSNQLALSILGDVQAALAQNASVPDSVLSDLAVARSTLEAALNMSEFMKMSINRCMDFAKVTNHNLKLVPSLETVHVAEALDLPLRCMAAVSDEKGISLKPLPADMCSHIITDAQWLQENVLCLLSNAVKYSSHGTVTLSLSLQTETAVLAKKSQQDLGSASTACLSGEDTGDRGFLVPTAESADELLLGCSTKSLLGAPPAEPGWGLGPVSTAILQGERVMVLVECEDTGIGLTDGAMANLFAPFKQAQRLAGGTGLGLFSLANRMTALYGHCGVHSRPDGAQGSVFWFAFPYKPDLVAAEAVAADQTEGELTAGNLAQLGERLSTVAPASPGMLTVDAVQTYDQKLGRRALLTGSPMQALSVADSWRASPPTVTPRAARQLVTRPSPVPPRSTPLSSCPPSPTSSDAMSGLRLLDSPGTESAILPAEDSLHVLLADDTPSIRKLCSRMLAREGYRVSTAENGFEALKLLAAGHFDAVLMDLQMPVMDGLEAVRRFRATERVPEGERRLFIVAVSANSDPNIPGELRALGFDGFIEKPFTVARLRAVLPTDLGV